MEKLIEELTKVNPSNLSEEGLKLFNKINEIIDRNKELFETCCRYEDTLEHYEYKIFDELDDYIGDEEGNQLADVIPDNEPLIDDQVNRTLVLSNLDQMLDFLTDREHDLLRLLYGIGMDPVDLTTISNMYGVGKERIRQMKDSALKKLKSQFANQLKGLL